MDNVYELWHVFYYDNDYNYVKLNITKYDYDTACSKALEYITYLNKTNYIPYKYDKLFIITSHVNIMDYKGKEYFNFQSFNIHSEKDRLNMLKIFYVLFFISLAFWLLCVKYLQ